MNTLFLTHVCCFILIFFEYSHLELIVIEFKFGRLYANKYSVQVLPCKYIFTFSVRIWSTNRSVPNQRHMNWFRQGYFFYANIRLSLQMNTQQNKKPDDFYFSVISQVLLN